MTKDDWYATKPWPSVSHPLNYDYQPQDLRTDSLRMSETRCEDKIKDFDMSNVEHFERIFSECLEIMSQKSRDYQNSNSSVRQADYYPRGLETILDEMHKKMLRLRSLLEARRHEDTEPVNESIEDNAKDLINYAAIFVAYSRGQIDGQ